jgi:hypothetical protein
MMAVTGGVRNSIYISQGFGMAEITLNTSKW